jgi:ABC-2 type transport system permease protein
MMPLSWYGRLRKYLMIFRVSLTERLAYRADFFLSTVLRFLPMLTTILLWTAIYGDRPPDAQIGRFTRDEMIAYLLMIHISRMFSSMPGLASGISRDIREGSLKRYLLQPIDMITYLVSYRAAHKTAYIITSALPYALLFLMCHQFFVNLSPPPWPVYILSLLLGFVIGFFFEACIGMIGFWFLDVSSLLYIVNAVNYFVSGQMLPLDLLGEPWTSILKSLPFQYLAYFPAAVFLGKLNGDELTQGLLIASAWAVFLILLSRGLFHLGLRRYSAFGG